VSFTVVLCTRDRAAVLLETLDALAAQDDRGFKTVVIDQSDTVDPAVERAVAREGWRLVHDEGRGVARARNLGWRSAETDWVVFLDDDVLPEPAWAGGMARAMAAHPDAAVIMGDTPAMGVPPGDYPIVSAFPVEREEVRRGRWLRPWLIGFTLNQAFRRTALERMGGFDERLGAGAPRFPSSADMDLNYRLLRSGEHAFLTPAARAHHNQWRDLDALGPHYERYMRGWSGFAMKQVRTGDVLGGLWLWSLGLHDFARMLASALRRRSLLRLRIAAAKARGLVVGTATGVAERW
jgi:GT2 family glycosyltransferase